MGEKGGEQQASLKTAHSEPLQKDFFFSLCYLNEIEFNF